ncbi:MAG: AEC family transporter [Desulfobulbus sp.]|nr:MAG: AEC family transporter [Desulfobulbus sp.]
MEQTLPFLLLLAVGQIMRRLPGFPADTDRALNLYVIFVALPALVLVQVPRLVLSRELLIPVLMPWAVVAFSGLLVWSICRLARWPREITGALLLLVPLGNTSFLGIPMVEQFFGESGIPYAILYDQFGSFLALSTYGTIILALYSGAERPRPREVIKRIVLFPPFLALAAALALHGTVFPAWLLGVLEMTARSLVPVVLVAIGFQVRLRMPAAEVLPFAAGLTVRLLVTPLVFIGLCALAGLSGPAVQVALFETAMPPMVTAGALASIAGLKPRLSSALVGFGIIASFLTLPLIHHLIK